MCSNLRTTWRTKSQTMLSRYNHFVQSTSNNNELYFCHTLCSTDVTCETQRENVTHTRKTTAELLNKGE